MIAAPFALGALINRAGPLVQRLLFAAEEVVEAAADARGAQQAAIRAGSPKLASVPVEELPELRISAKKYRELAENIRHAQKAGHPEVLTHGGNIRANRAVALRDVPNIRPLSRDEYPFASTLEGGPGAWVGHIPRKQNEAQGGLIRQFLERNNIMPGDRYRIIIGE